MPKWRSRSHALAIVAISFPVSQPSGTVSTRRSKCLDPGRLVTFLQRYSSRIWLRIADELLGRKITSSSADLVQFLNWMSASSLKARGMRTFQLIASTFGCMASEATSTVNTDPFLPRLLASTVLPRTKQHSSSSESRSYRQDGKYRGGGEIVARLVRAQYY